MRNCFVPGCDAYCKKINLTHRKMFLAPAKMMEKWTEVLHNKRPFKSHDRVCERHFRGKEDIIEFWESNINGEIHLTPRDKPKLRENAIPSRNLPSLTDFLKPEDRLLEKRKEKVKILSQRIMSVNKRRKVDSLDEKNDEKQPKLESQISLTKEVPSECVNINEAVVEFELDTASDEHLKTFESLYEEVFDVTLPSLLWGIHRDPQSKFLVFSEFNQISMSTSKLLHISNTLRCSILINNKLFASKKLNTAESTTDQVEKILDELDKTQTPLS